MDRKVVGIIFFGKVVVVISPQLLNVVWCGVVAVEINIEVVVVVVVKVVVEVVVVVVFVVVL